MHGFWCFPNADAHRGKEPVTGLAAAKAKGPARFQTGGPLASSTGSSDRRYLLTEKRPGRRIELIKNIK
jgi:hypothetical protein